MLGKSTLQILAGAIALMILTQCQTMSLDMQKSGSVPRVTIEGVYREQVISACTEVLREHDYRFSKSRGSVYLYEKPGTTMDFLAWGGFSSDQEVVIRLAVSIRELGNAQEVEAQPFIVLRPGEHMEEARKISRLKTGKYQKLLDEVKDRVFQGGDTELEDWEAWD